jgi:CDP-glucose 4,6-dehydratase
LARDPSRFSSAWNFGPEEGISTTVQQLVDRFLALWPGHHSTVRHESAAAGEHRMLRVDSTKARQNLGWRPTWGMEDTLRATVDWYRAFQESSNNALAKSIEQIREYGEAARRAGVAWAQ